jgi:multidrug efflux pump
MAHFFIRRPVFAWVIAIVIMLGGALAIATLSISQYPDIAPTTVRVSATYNGASAETVEKSVTTIIEDGMTGLDDLTYMTSSSSTGSAEVTLTFGNSILPDIAQVQVQNKLQLVQSQLPDTVQQRGIQVSRSTSSILMVGALISTDGKRNSADLGDVFSSRVEDQIKRLEGVGSINVFGSEYAMRIWLDPFKLNKYQLTTADVTSAIESQNTQVSVGSLGAVPAVKGQQLNVTVTAPAHHGCRFRIGHPESRKGRLDRSSQRRRTHRNRPGNLWRRFPVERPSFCRFRGQPRHGCQRARYGSACKVGAFRR